MRQPLQSEPAGPTQNVLQASVHLMLAAKEVRVAASWVSKDDGAWEGGGGSQGKTPALFSPRNLSGSKQHLLAYVFPTRDRFGLPQEATA